MTWNWKRWPWTKPLRVELGAGLTGMSREQARRLAASMAPELRAKPPPPPTERERARASLMEFTGMWFDGMSDEERRELAVKLGEAFRKAKEADNEQGG